MTKKYVCNYPAEVFENNQKGRDMTDWILCNDKLPAIGERVIVLGVHLSTGATVIDMARHHSDGWSCKKICAVVAWMPLPKALEKIDKYFLVGEGEK